MIAGVTAMMPVAGIIPPGSESSGPLSPVRASPFTGGRSLPRPFDPPWAIYLRDRRVARAGVAFSSLRLPRVARRGSLRRPPGALPSGPGGP